MLLKGIFAYLTRWFANAVQFSADKVFGVICILNGSHLCMCLFETRLLGQNGEILLYMVSQLTELHKLACIALVTDLHNHDQK